MNYPEGTPQILVEVHQRQTNRDPLTASKFRSHDIEVIIADLVQKYSGDEKLTEENIEDIRRNLYRNSLGGLSDQESTDLLERLITDLRMKDVWKSLAKRIEDEREYVQFVNACEGGITGWRGDLKQTPSERKAFYQEIWDAAAKLQSLMGKSGEFHHYYINSLVGDKEIEWLQEVLEAPNDVQYTRFCLHDIIPSIYEVLNDVAAKAKQYAEEEPSVKKPNSPNAEIHYFIRLLSSYCQRRYNQPLHETVAITASVIFDQMNIDTDYVRKIVKR